MKRDIASVLEIDRIVNVIHRRCEDMGVELEFDPYADTAMTGHTKSGSKRIVLPVIKQPVTMDAMEKLYGFVIHECGHHTRPEAFEILEALPEDTPQPLLALFNIAEDDGMERQVAQAYKGDAVALGRQNEIILGEIVESWKDKVDPNAEVTEQQVAPLSVCALGQLSRLSWDGHSNRSRSAFFNAQHPTAKKLTEKLADEGWVDRLQETRDPDDCWDVACDLYNRLYPASDKEEEEQREDIRQKGHSKVPSDDGGPKAGQGQDAGGEDDNRDGGGGEGCNVSWKDAVISEHSEWGPSELNGPNGGIGITWEDYTKGEVSLMPQHMVNVVDLSSNKEKPEARNSWCKVGTPASFMPDNSSSRAFGNQIRRYMQAQARTKVQRERKSGRLDKSSIVRLVLPPIDGGEYNKKIFYDHTKRKELNTAIMVLTDWSGSMHGQKMVHAADASGRLVHVFDRILRCPVALAAFTDAKTPCDIGLIKRFGDRSVGPKEIATRFSKFYKYSSANNDADSVLWAYNYLKTRKEARRVLMVLSDGAPAGGWNGYGSSHANLKKVTKDIEKDKTVELYGVGICSDAVKNYYTNYKVLHDSADINRTLFEIIKEGDHT